MSGLLKTSSQYTWHHRKYRPLIMSFFPALSKKDRIERRQKHSISRQIRNYVNKIDPTADVILYGSRARGDEKHDSDWDILILTSYAADLTTERKFRDKLYDLELATGEVFSVFVYSKSDWQSTQKITPFYHNVLREGVPI